jgi:hypothetical protein
MRSSGQPPLHESGREDGALFALVGFLQQMLGTAADYIRYSGLKLTGHPRFESVIVETEVGGQDSVASGVSTSGHKLQVITQYKFSLGRRPIDAGGAAEIISGLESAKGPKRPRQATVELRLCSNRPLTPPAEHALRKSKIKYEIYDPISAQSTLREYASRFGTNDREFRSGATNLAGYLIDLATSPGSHQLDRAEFDKRLAGLDHPCSIRISDAANRLHKNLENQRWHYVGSRATLAYRKTLGDAITSSAYDALIVLEGDGGTGKTTAIWQMLNDTVAGAAPQLRLTHLMSPSETVYTFGELIEKLRGGANSNSDDDAGMERLKLANGGASPPLLVLGLDGIDEIDPSDPALEKSRRLIRFFWSLHTRHMNEQSRPPARLLVSCRERRDVEAIIQTRSGTGVREPAPLYIPVGSFEDSDLAFLLRSPGGEVTPDVAKKLLAALDAGPLFREDTEFAKEVADDQAGRCLHLLRHPKIWHCFTMLTPEQQDGILQQDDRAFMVLAEMYLKWFQNRANFRRHRFDPEDIILVLRNVAGNCFSASKTYQQTEWVQCTMETLEWPLGRAEHFYREAVHSGLVDVESQRAWRWRHEFLVKYLTPQRGEAGA